MGIIRKAFIWCFWRQRWVRCGQSSCRNNSCSNPCQYHTIYKTPSSNQTLTQKMDLGNLGIQPNSDPNGSQDHVSHLALDIGGSFSSFSFNFYEICIFFFFPGCCLVSLIILWFCFILYFFVFNLMGFIVFMPLLHSLVISNFWVLLVFWFF